MKQYIQKIRYPPFEYSHMNADKVPLVEVIVETECDVDNEFKIGKEDSWYIEWSEYKNNEKRIPKIDCEVKKEVLPFLMKTRNGWYISPDPLHLTSRKIITPTVIILILSILIHATEPGLLELGIISNSFAGSYRFGPLDYPKLLLFSFPIFLLPLLIRMIANMRDISRQNEFVKNPLKPPEIEIEKNENSINITIINNPIGIELKRARLQVGVAVPEREKILQALGRGEGGQPAPGMSTKPPEKRISTGDEMGTGVGEATPMVVPHRRILMLDSLRVLDFGPWIDLNSNQEEVKLFGPKDNWPSSIYSSLITIHWELIIDAIKKDGTKMKWVRPVIMKSDKKSIILPELPVRSGRIEMADY